MGTHINIIFPHQTAIDADDVAEQMSRAFGSAQSALDTIKEHAWYSIEFGDWLVSQNPAHGDESPYIEAEGPYGFDISIHPQTCCLGHPERFLRLHSEESPVAVALQAVVLSVVRTISGQSPFICVAGGAGDSDPALDLASQGGTFADICCILTQRLGSPAKTWGALASHSWAFLQSGDR